MSNNNKYHSVQHPAAQAAVGSRDEKGNIIGTKKDSIMYSKK